MNNKKYSFKGTIIAIIVIVILVLLTKFVFKEDFSEKVTIVEPTEGETMPYFQGTRLSVLPTE